jgi:hypothetical protein
MKLPLLFSLAVATAVLTGGPSCWAEGDLDPAAMFDALQQASLPVISKLEGGRPVAVVTPIKGQDEKVTANSNEQPRGEYAMHAMIRVSATLVAVAVAIPAIAADPDWMQVGQALGKSGTVQAGGVYRVGFPRTDLKVTVDGVALRPGFALGGWVAFQPIGGQAMVMGDLVMTQDEVGPVMRKLREGGIEITALHNHLLRAEPMTLYMHIEAHGDPAALASAVHAGLAAGKTPFNPPPGTAQPANIDMIGIDSIMGYRGQDSGGVYQFSIPRAQPVKDAGMDIAGPMGGAIAINFQPTGFDTAAITGDFILEAKEVNPVISALQAGGIEVTALHSHMLNEQPRMFFLHFWANDDARKLAKGLRAALDKVDVWKEVAHAR